MVKLKKIILSNYCGYKRKFELDLSDESGVKKWAIFCGPNGIGKSNFIRAAQLLTNPGQLKGRKPSTLLRSLKYNKNYIQQFRNVAKNVTDLFMAGIFIDESNEEKQVIIQDTFKGILGGNLIDETLNEEERILIEWDRQNAISGVMKDELSDINNSSFSVFIDADKPNNMHIFQLFTEVGDVFVDFAKAVYGYDCYLPKDSIQDDSQHTYYTDFVLIKPDGEDLTQVHYKSFSDGEKKIATLLSTLVKKCHRESSGMTKDRIILVDNIEMHIYWKRHMLLMDKMEELFPDHQIICTTHSPVIITQMNKKYIYDLEKFLKS